MEKLGVDIGRVIIDGGHHPEGADTAFFTGDIAQLLRTPAMADVFEVLPRLVDRFGGRVWLVSTCSARVRERTLSWLAHHRFAERTGIPAQHVRFCRRRVDKAVHCAELGITHFIDDRPEVHEALNGLVAHRYLFGEQTGATPPGLVRTLNWFDVEREIERGGVQPKASAAGRLPSVS